MSDGPIDCGFGHGAYEPVSIAEMRAIQYRKTIAKMAGTPLVDECVVPLNGEKVPVIEYVEQLESGRTT